MQTFLPYPDFKKSLACLDDKRLGKQRVEAKQILTGDFPNHPASLMWDGYKDALKLYHNLAIDEWVSRGFSNMMGKYEIDTVVLPHWLGGPIHASHRSNLLRKQPLFYMQYRWVEPDNLPYHWPI